MKVILLRHAKANREGLTEEGAKQAIKMRALLDSKKLLPEQPVAFCSTKERAQLTAQVLVEGRTSFINTEDWLNPNGMNWYKADQETGIMDNDVLAENILAEHTTLHGPHAETLRQELTMLRNLLGIKAASVQMPDDEAVIMITHMEYMLAAEPVLGFHGRPVVRECEGYLLEISPDLMSARCLEFLQAL